MKIYKNMKNKYKILKVFYFIFYKMSLQDLYSQAIKFVNDEKYDQAIELYKKILSYINDSFQDKINLLYQLGNLYEKKNMFKNAIAECYINIIKIDPKNYVILNQIGVCYNNMSQYKLAINYFKKVINIQEIPDVYHNIGLCYRSIHDYESSKKEFLNALKMDKNNNIYKSSLGDTYYILKEYDNSIKTYQSITDYKTNHKEMYSSSFSYLAKKNFEKGFELYENRLKYNNINPQTKLFDRLEIPSINYWNTCDSCDKLLIISEQGIGDNIQYYRFIIELSELYPNMLIHFFCKKEISHIFKKYNNIEVVDNLFIELMHLYGYNYKIYIMSLPYILKKTSILPNSYNYINIHETKLTYWNEQFQQFKRYKVGFVYNGLLSSFIEKYIPLKYFETLCDLNIDLICIHKKEGIQKDIDSTNINLKDKIHFFDIDIDKPFEDTIHILKNIDLLITIDTFIVHLAGVLGVKTWLLLGNYSEWRWSNEDNTYWYSSVELIRNNKNGDFYNILQEVKNKLNYLLLNCENNNNSEIENI